MKASLRAQLTRGRPMILLGPALHDVVSGRQIYYWCDRLGRLWMAEHAWSLFRVPSERPWW